MNLFKHGSALDTKYLLNMTKLIAAGTHGIMTAEDGKVLLIIAPETNTFMVIDSSRS